MATRSFLKSEFELLFPLCLVGLDRAVTRHKCWTCNWRINQNRKGCFVELEIELSISFGSITIFGAQTKWPMRIGCNICNVPFFAVAFIALFCYLFTAIYILLTCTLLKNRVACTRERNQENSWLSDWVIFRSGGRILFGADQIYSALESSLPEPKYGSTLPSFRVAKYFYDSYRKKILYL